jgi:hypothetical protein
MRAVALVVQAWEDHPSRCSADSGNQLDTTFARLPDSPGNTWCVSLKSLWSRDGAWAHYAAKQMLEAKP